MEPTATPQQRSALLWLQIRLVDEVTMYSIRPITTEAGSLLGWRLSKDADSHYNIMLHPYETCDCADFEYRREGKDPKGCKHILALRAFHLMGTKN